MSIKHAASSHPLHTFTDNPAQTKCINKRYSCQYSCIKRCLGHRHASQPEHGNTKSLVKGLFFAHHTVLGQARTAETNLLEEACHAACVVKARVEEQGLDSGSD